MIYNPLKIRITLLSLLVVGALCMSACTKTPDNSDFENVLKPDTNDKTDVTKAAGDLRLMCYNVHRCEGMDKVFDYNRIAKIINTVQPDFVCLQELDSMTQRSANVNQVKILGEKCNMHGYFGGAIPYSGGKYGVGILSKEPALKTYLYNLAPGGSENRVILIAEFNDYLVISVHLDHVHENSRTASVKIITEHVRRLNKKAFLAGDLNEDKMAGEMFNEFYKDWSILSSTGNTFPTEAVRKRIDFVLGFSPKTYPYNITKSAVIYNLPGVSVPTASDHFPLFVDFTN